jgi:hypothetical protein
LTSSGPEIRISSPALKETNGKGRKGVVDGRRRRRREICLEAGLAFCVDVSEAY